MCADYSLRERFWRDVAGVVGHGFTHGDLDPHAVREAVEDMMRNYGLDEVPGFETTPEARPDLPDTTDFPRHSAFAPVFRLASTALSSLACFNAARPIFVGPHMRPRHRSGPEAQDSDPFPGGGNPGVQADTDPDPPTNPTPVVNRVSPWHHAPPLPPWIPHHYVWAFPTGHLAWTPHSQPSPFVPTWAGAHPIQGTTPQWTPGTCPPLDWTHDIPIRLSPHIIPNPNNPHLPLIDWNVSKHPSTAKRFTPNHVVVDLDRIWDDAVTHIDASTVVATCDVGHASTLWGPIVVKHDDDRPVTLRNLLDAIYQHFQVPLTYQEVQYICHLHASNYDRLTDAYYERCRESVALPGWEARQGFRRVDVLGDRKYWWGMWIVSRHGAWWLHLGLMNPAHRVPFR